MRTSFMRRLAWRVEAALELVLVVTLLRLRGWGWAREQLRPVAGRDDFAMRRELSQAAQSAARRMPFRALCVPFTIVAMRMLKRRGIAARVRWSVPDGRGMTGHVEVDPTGL